jgi:hypothetical protein
MDPFWTAIVGGILGLGGGAASGVLSAYATLRASRESSQGQQEIEKEKIRSQILRDILGSRYVMTGNAAFSDDKAIFNRSINLIPIVFADEKEILDAFDDFHANKSDENLIRLLKIMSKRLGFEVPSTRIKTVLTV